MGKMTVYHGSHTAGREDRKVNDLFYTCSLIEYIGRKTKNKRAAVVNALGREAIEKIGDYNSSFFYEAPQNILNAYLTGVIE